MRLVGTIGLQIINSHVSTTLLISHLYLSMRYLGSSLVQAVRSDRLIATNKISVLHAAGRWFGP